MMSVCAQRRTGRQGTLAPIEQAKLWGLGQSPAQHLAYEVSLWRVPMVLTTNFWDVAPLCPEDLDWVEQNCVVVPITSSVMVDSDEQDDV